MDFQALISNYISIIKDKYAKFDGRARRKEYWSFFAVNMAVAIVFSILVAVPLLGGIFVAISSLYSLAVLVPGIAATIRRLHDIGKPWHWIFVSFIPLVGSIWLIVLLAQEGVKGDNEFGPDPKAE